MSIEQVANAVDTDINRLPYMESLYQQAKDQAEKMQHTVQRLANDIVGLERKISILDKTAFSCEQDCKRTEQQVREHIAQKDRLEKLIANILNGEDYSKLQQFVKENVRAVLSENKQVMSLSFAALILTLKADPEKFHLIYNTHTAANESGHVDDNDNANAIKYSEFNRDSLLDLAEKNYENLVEALTNNAIDSATCSNPALSLPQSLPTFNLGPDNQRDKYRIEDSEIYHNSKGDIAE